MTVSTHVYAAEIQGSPVKVLKVVGGSVSLDVTRWPHVRATLTVTAEPGLYAALDPRTAARRVTLRAIRDGGAARVFNLGVRSVSGRADGTLEVALASDEALMEDFGPAADIDPADTTFGYSAGGLARMVLDKIGATVADPTPNPLLAPYWRLQNLVVNPRFQSTTKGAATMGETSGLASVSHVATGSAARRALQWTCPVAGGSVMVAGFDPASAKVDDISVTPGEWVYASAEVSAVAANRGRRLAFAFYNSIGFPFRTVSFPTQSAADGRWVTVTGLYEVPMSAVYMAVIVEGFPIAAGADQRMFASNVFAVKSDRPVPMFNGSTPGDAWYTYDWDGDIDDSPSTRYPIIERTPESLIWRAGQGGISYLNGLLQSAGLRLVCDESRAWSLRHIDHTVPGAVSVGVGVNMIDYSIAGSIDEDDWCDAADVVYKWASDGIEKTRTDSYQAGAGTPRKRIRVELNEPYPGPGRAEHLVTRRLAGGRPATATAVAEWTVKTEQALTITHLDGEYSGLVGAVTFDLDADEMTVVARKA